MWPLKVNVDILYFLEEEAGRLQLNRKQGITGILCLSLFYFLFFFRLYFWRVASLIFIAFYWKLTEYHFFSASEYTILSCKHSKPSLLLSTLLFSTIFLIILPFFSPLHLSTFLLILFYFLIEENTICFFFVIFLPLKSCRKLLLAPK